MNDNRVSFGWPEEMTGNLLWLFGAVLAIAGFLVVLFWPLGGARAQEQCLTQESVLALYMASPLYASHGNLTGDEAERAVALYNASPPQSDDKFNLVILVLAVEGHGGALLLGNDGMLCNNLVMGPDMLRKFHILVFGRDA